jgi:3-oxoadipate enol-lactonase
MTLHHEVAGDGRVVVLSGSLGSTLAMWDAQVAALREQFRVLRYDHPGHGGSPLGEIADVGSLARGVVDLLDELEIERASFCGLSLGGAVGMRLALDAPGRIDRLVLACTAARFGTPETWDERISLVRTGGMEAVSDVVLPRWFTPEFADVQTFRAMLVALPPDTYVRYCEIVREFDLRGALGSIGSPTLAIAGAEDRTAPPEQVEALAEEIPGARLAVIERAAHLANVERPAEFNRALLAHLAGPRPSTWLDGPQPAAQGRGPG